MRKGSERGGRGIENVGDKEERERGRREKMIKDEEKRGRRWLRQGQGRLEKASGVQRRQELEKTRKGKKGE